VIGDVRDKDRVKECAECADLVIHAAALKCIEACENNPVECLKTYVIGTQNIIDSLEWVDKAVLISTDKAVQPINIYGTSKKMAEKLWISAGNNVARYGNVIGSAGSVLPLYRKLIAEGAKSLPVTDVRMTRFWYPMREAVELVLEALESEDRGEMFIPQIPSIRITDLCEALDMPYHVVGIRAGEKLHETMIAPSDIDDSEGYSSGNNPHFLTIDEIKESIYGI
jgi:UDP-N-acetylglucosamine 4,6-dehydratase